MKKIIRLTESDLARIVKKVIKEKEVINEQLWKTFANNVAKLSRTYEDDMVRAFRNLQSAAAKEIDDIVSIATKARSLAKIEDLEAGLIATFRRGGHSMDEAQKRTIAYLNGFAKSRGKSGWIEIRNQARPAAAAASTTNVVKNLMAGQRVSNRWKLWRPENIDFSKFSQPMTIDQLDKQIAQAIKTGNYNLIPRKGFEKFGIDDFRKFIRDQMGNGARINEVIPERGRWSVNFVSSF